MKRFAHLVVGEQFKWANVVPHGCDGEAVYTAEGGIKPSDTYYADAAGLIAEADPYLFVRTKVLKEVWE